MTHHRTSAAAIPQSTQPSNPAHAPAPTLPVERAFVVQLSSTAELTYGVVSGRVEHVHSGQAAHFQSLAELLAFMEQVLATLPPESPREPVKPPNAGEE